ncbi:MAG: F0F1 ATP synthase subunit alpha [Clostridia bacterium]|nr:F0F1 ATP synthase subunit alpha [Clostridia bacterium]
MSENNHEKISAYLKRKIAAFQPEPIVYRQGRVAKVGDGVVRVTDLPGRLYGELLEFDGGAFGMVLDLEENGAGVVLMDRAETVHVGEGVKGTGVVAKVPVGESLIGRVIDPIGRPLDGKPLEAADYLPVERSAPAIMDRQPVHKPLQTGILAIDSMIPIGRGQRESIIGDRQTGKTSIAVDTILNQKQTDVICLYCAIGQKASQVAQVVDILQKNGALAYTAVVAATAADSPAMQYLAPYAAASVAESFMENGRDVLVVYDDLSKHAVAYRTMSLLLHRPPGREAFPGDVFYLHSRLLERSACLDDEHGGGSMTALPIIETVGNNLSAYIPTNVISITDGQIYLEADLFHSGVRPAVNTGLSVSRVGRAAQHKAMRQVSGTLRIDLSKYRELAAFTSFGSDVDEATRRQLDRGRMLVELLKQGRSAAYTLFEEVALLIAYQEKIFDSDRDLREHLPALLQDLRENAGALADRVTETGTLTDSDAELLLEQLKQFKESV